MLKILGVSRSGYRAWLKHVPSNAEKRRESVKAKIKDIYDKSKQNYGAPKITQVLRKTGETISERTVIWKFTMRGLPNRIESIQRVLAERGKTVYATAVRAGAILADNGNLKLLGDVKVFGR